MALALANAQGMKRTDWLQATYQDLLEEDSEDTVDRLASIIRLTDILDKSNSKLNLKFTGRRKIRLRLERGPKRFPEEVYVDALREFRDAFKLKIVN
jgi:hypothetical protein